MTGFQSLENNKRIAKNTIMLYVRQLLALFIGLYTVRVVLDVLGVEDYGLYNVVAGIVALLSFLSGTMATASQRFFSFAIGQNDNEKLNRILSVNLIIYISIAIFAAFFLETIGLWYVKNRLIVPVDRLPSIVFIFHCSVIMFVASIFSAPLTAIIIAYEDMKYFAYVSVADSLLRLTVVFLLSYMALDKLELYGALNLVVSIIIFLTYLLICYNKYKELKFSIFFWEKKLFKEIFGFTGWTLFGRISTVSRYQAITILLNQTFSPATVAARAISFNISSKINMFSSSFNVGLYPSIIKSYASEEKDDMYKLIFNGSKITFFLMWVFALPLFLEMDVILSIWLKNLPEEAVLFTRLTVIESLILSISLPLTTAARAPGKMKNYELILGIIQFTIFIFAWGVLQLGYPAYSVFIVAIVVNILMFFVRLYLVRNLIGLKAISFLKKVCVPLLFIMLLSIVVSYGIKVILPKGIWYSILIMMLSVISSSISMYFIGLNKEWKLKINSLILAKLKR